MFGKFEGVLQMHRKKRRLFSEHENSYVDLKTLIQK